MPKTKKNLFALSKNAQLALLTTAVLAFVANAIFMLMLLIRVYPDGMRLSQFSIMAIGSIVFPAAIFAIAHLANKQKNTRLTRLFIATQLTMIGLIVHGLMMLIERYLINPNFPYTDDLSSNIGITWPFVAAFILSVGLMLYLRRRPKNTQLMRLQQFFVATVALIFIINTALNLRQVIGQDIISLLTHVLFVIPILLPILFFITAYYVLTKKGQRWNRFYTATVYTVIGFLITSIVTSLWSIGMQFLSKQSNINLLYNYHIAIVACTSLVLFAGLVIRHKLLLKRS